jgi:hypothetical protein
MVGRPGAHPRVSAAGMSAFMDIGPAFASVTTSHLTYCQLQRYGKGLTTPDDDGISGAFATSAFLRLWVDKVWFRQSEFFHVQMSI